MATAQHITIFPLPSVRKCIYVDILASNSMCRIEVNILNYENLKLKLLTDERTNHTHSVIQEYAYDVSIDSLNHNM
jgi:hypothetical protein